MNNHESFTLIEILIVSSIIVLMSGMSLVYMLTYKDDKMLSAQVATLTRALELAKVKATSGDASLCSNSASAHVSGYSVAVSPNNITLLPSCDTVPTPLIFTVPSNIEYITPTFAMQFDGRNYQGETRQFPIKNTDTNKCKFVQIDQSGFITNGDYVCPIP